MAVRLRNAFRYPDDSAEEREELDEEDQERVILQLQHQNEARNAQYSMGFTLIPLISTLAFVPSLFSASGIPERLWSVLALLSLLATAYTMRQTPLHADRKGKKPLSVEDERLAWIRTALVPANQAACLLLTVVYLLFLRSESTYVIRPVLYLVPGGRSCPPAHELDCPRSVSCLTLEYVAMLAVILLAREVMLSVDLSALKDLQYEYKGA
ncbi:hypothetical protein N7492_002872 [Penicillium capsulatum]|uniref:Uncharacterized protein n=1 Tax=Penicillium capsulatum TaxID=69766 RepID=A0A9W9LWU4_9EURO|nr:hypothetical protein N7492_002872 [Penicillium capsulatum]KAJ6122531.1 hypothetical protein N7512_004996 [Penicillium capsulatum]